MLIMGLCTHMIKTLKLQEDLNNAKHWSNENKVPLNNNKTTCMTIGNKKELIAFVD